MKRRKITKNIVGHFNVSNTNADDFHKNLERVVGELQEDGQDVEIQYNVNVLLNGERLYSALILGRK